MIIISINTKLLLPFLKNGWPAVCMCMCLCVCVCEDSPWCVSLCPIACGPAVEGSVAIVDVHLDCPVNFDQVWWWWSFNQLMSFDGLVGGRVVVAPPTA